MHVRRHFEMSKNSSHVHKVISLKINLLCLCKKTDFGAKVFYETFFLSFLHRPQKILFFGKLYVLT
jgi:hypothetical protein